MLDTLGKSNPSVSYVAKSAKSSATNRAALVSEPPLPRLIPHTHTCLTTSCYCLLARCSSFTLQSRARASTWLSDWRDGPGNANGRVQSNAYKSLIRYVCVCQRVELLRAQLQLAQMDLLDAHLIVFVLPTTGNGAPPPAFVPLWTSLLHPHLPPDLLDHLQ